MILRLSYFFVVVILTAACQNPSGGGAKESEKPHIKTEGLETLGDTSRFLFMGHIYERFSKTNSPDPRTLEIDFGAFDGLWLGGDVTPYPVETAFEMQLLDSVFNLSAQSTLWSKGNHDWCAATSSLCREVLRKDSWSTWSDSGLGVIAYNSAMDPQECELKERQWEELEVFLNQAEDLNCLIFMSHHAIWVEHANQDEVALTANAMNGRWYLTCDPEDTFDARIWPRLTELSKNGTQVICLSGDAGTKQRKTGHWRTDENIDLLIAGMYDSYYLARNEAIPDSADTDKVIVFEYLKNEGRLDWEFVPVDSLVRESSR